jgi:hypothetical protein
MKSLIKLALLFFLVAAFSCRPPKAPQEETPSPDTDSLSVEAAPAVGDTLGPDTFLLND